MRAVNDFTIAHLTCHNTVLLVVLVLWQGALCGVFTTTIERTTA